MFEIKEPRIDPDVGQLALQILRKPRNRPMKMGLREKLPSLRKRGGMRFLRDGWFSHERLVGLAFILLKA